MEIKVGDKVIYRGAWCRGVETEATILSIEECTNGDKYGKPVNSISNIRSQECVCDLDDNHWCYGYQIIRKVG